MNDLTFKIVFLFLPGIFAVTILEIFNDKNIKYTTNQKIFYSFILSIISYFLYELIKYIFYFIKFMRGEDCEKINRSENILLKLINFDKNKFPFTAFEIFILVIIGIILGIIFVKFRENGYIHRIACKLGITYNTGYSTVLDNIYKSGDLIPETLRKKYVCIQLLDGSAKYEGFISLYEKQKDYTEILLTGNNDITSKENVYITYKDGKTIEEKALYLSLKEGSFTIEFRE